MEKTNISLVCNFRSVDNGPQSEAQKFYEVDALGDDYVDFGALTGPRGAFSWHATYRLER